MNVDEGSLAEREQQIVQLARARMGADGERPNFDAALGCAIQTQLDGILEPRRRFLVLSVLRGLWAEVMLRLDPASTELMVAFLLQASARIGDEHHREARLAPERRSQIQRFLKARQSGAKSLGVRPWAVRLPQ